MTVCIAAICDNDKIIGIADKKLTVNSGVVSAYDLNENKKIVQLTKNCTALFAGNVQNAHEVLKKVKPQINTNDTVESIAKKVVNVCTEVYNYLVESQLLGQYGLNLKTFNAQQKSLDNTFVSTTVQTISQNNLGIEILVIGKDKGVPQIIKIGLGNSFVDETPLGYSCIGSGADHARLSLIESACHPSVTFDNALYAVARAKRKAEADPNVGEKSDIVLIDKSVQLIEDKLVKSVFVKYDESLEEIQSISDNTSKKMGEVFNGNTAK